MKEGTEERKVKGKTIIANQEQPAYCSPDPTRSTGRS